jgi:ferredoxin--NADP+ reductase
MTAGEAKQTGQSAAPARVGSAERPLRVAIVGSGPAGFFVALALRKQQAVPTEIDIFDRLPTPYGLVRGGVAPDHQSIKGVTKVFERGATTAEGFRFFGNVELGVDVELQTLGEHYDQIVLATGNEASRRLGVPGEGIARCTPAAVFVGWYNGHPDYVEAQFDFSVRRVAIVGHGNVAIDVARILAKEPTELAATDIATHALDQLAGNTLEEIVLLGRRGPVQAAFTPAELKELGELSSAVPLVDPEDLALDEHSAAQLEQAPKQVQRNLELLREFSQREAQPGQRRLRLRFCVSPKEIVAAADGGVGGLRLGRNRLEPTPEGQLSAVDSGVAELLPVDMVLSAIGFRGQPLPGVPFDPEQGVIRNVEGRICDADERLWTNHYVVGWAQSGPRGLIGAHKRASAQVAELMLEDLAAGRVPAREMPARDALPQLLAERGIELVTFDDWRRLDAVERDRGQRRGAPRDKLTDVDEMLAVARDGAPSSSATEMS